MRRSSTKRLPGRLSAFQASAGQPAPVVRGLFPARHSLPWPKAGLRDQATRARTTGKPVPPGGFGASPNAPGNVSQSLDLRGPVARGMVPRLPAGAKTDVPQRCTRLRVDDMRRPLAASLMVSIVVFQAGDGTFGAVPANEIDGDEVALVAEYDPFEIMAR
jgi:hypothetical protein